MHFNKDNLYTFINKFNKEKISNLKNISNVIFRNYQKKIDFKTIIKVRNECKKYKLKLYLSNDIKLAIRANLNGVYIPSFNKSLYLSGFKNIRRDFKILGSAHNIKDLKLKEKQGVDIIFLSPLFLTKNYNNCLGIIKFNLISINTKKSVIALGGIRKNNIKKMNMINALGFSGITIFE